MPGGSRAGATSSGAVAQSGPTPPPSLPCPDWVWCTGSNVHIAKDRSWFGDDYVPFKSEVSPLYGSGPMARVEGIGTVLLPTKRSPDMRGPDAHGTLRLENVLHVPGFLCNIVGRAKGSLDRDAFPDRNGVFYQNGQPVAYLRQSAVSLSVVRLSGPPVGPRVGPSVLKANCALNATWSDAERNRWQSVKTQLYSGPPSFLDQPDPDANDDVGIALHLTEKEKKWLKEKWGCEYRFLRAHGLNIHKNEHREEGRQILKTLMHSDGEVEDN